MNTKLLTIIICTYNRARFLNYCLQSLFQQSVSIDCFDVIVVNNNSNDDTKKVIADFETKSNSIRGFLELNQGLSYARNTGYLNARTEWVAYLDDDAIARENWVETILDTIRTNKYSAFGGIYLPWYLDGKVKWFKDVYASNKKFFKREGVYPLSGIQFISGGNAVYKLNVLKETGGFPVDLGMKGDSISYGEENYVQMKIKNMGYELGINTSLIIDHYVPLKKQTVRWYIDSYKIKGSLYWKDKSVSFVEFVVFILQGILSVNFTFFKSIIKLFQSGYYKENFLIDVCSKFQLYWNAIKKYKSNDS